MNRRADVIGHTEPCLMDVQSVFKDCGRDPSSSDLGKVMGSVWPSGSHNTY